MSERLFTYDELAIYLHVSKSWLWKQVREEKLKPRRFSRRVSRFPESEVNRFIAGSPQLQERFRDFAARSQVVEESVTGTLVKS